MYVGLHTFAYVVGPALARATLMGRPGLGFKLRRLSATAIVFSCANFVYSTSVCRDCWDGSVYFSPDQFKYNAHDSCRTLLIEDPTFEQKNTLRHRQ